MARGTLTNFATISRRIEALIQLEEDFAKGEVQAHTKRELLMKQTEVRAAQQVLRRDQRDYEIARRDVRRGDRP